MTSGPYTSLTPAPPSAPATAEVREIARQVRLSKSQHVGTYESSPFVYFPVGSVEKLLSAIDALPSFTAPASAASFRDGVEAIEAARDRYVAAVDPDPHARTAWQSGAIEDGFRLSLAAIGKNNRERQEELETFFPAATKGGPSADEIAEWRRLSDDASEDLSQSGASIPGAVERFNHAAIVNFMWIVECVAAERERAEKAEREMTRAIEERDHWYRQAVGDEAAMRERALQTQVTRLTEDLAARTKERDDLSAQVYVPGQWVCAKCKFTLQQMVMSAVDGSVTAQDKPGEPCPNCASPLWRTTWKQEASEMQERAIEQMERERDEARKHAANTRIRERVEGDNLRSRIDQEAARADALQQRVGALEEARSKTDAEIVAEVEDVARLLMKTAIGTGYEVPPDYVFRTSKNTRSRRAWAVAMEVYELITGTEVHDAVQSVEEDAVLSQTTPNAKTEGV